MNMYVSEIWLHEFSTEEPKSLRLCWEDGRRSLGLERHSGQNGLRRKKESTDRRNRETRHRQMGIFFFFMSLGSCLDRRLLSSSGTRS